MMTLGRKSLALLLLTLLACRKDQPPIQGESSQARERQTARPADAPACARWDLQDYLQDDLRQERSPSDGGGQVFLLEGGETTAGQPGRWKLAYEAGPLGVQQGGMLYFEVSPWWGWSPPQTQLPGEPGYTLLSTDVEGLVLEAIPLGDQILGIRMERTGPLLLAPNERVVVDYGAGERGANADRYAEAAPSLWFAVDGDGDGVRKLVAEAPSILVRPGPPAGVIVFAPSLLRPAEQGLLRVSLLDSLGSAGIAASARIEIIAPPELGLPEEVTMTPRDGGSLAIPFRPSKEGIHRVGVRVHLEGDSQTKAKEKEAMSAISNAVMISTSLPRVLWGDVHGHSARSDGTSTPAAWYRYARDVSGLDFAALTDHDHWGLKLLDQHPELWQEMRDAAREAEVKGTFTTLLGYEWTSWVWGHRHVLSFDEPASSSLKVCSSLQESCDEPGELRSGLKGTRSLIIPHHPAGGPVAATFPEPLDPMLEPVVEICSVHGNSESPDMPGAIYHPIAGHFARDLLEQGLHLGFIGGGDGHDGHPGLSHIASPQGGLMATLGAENERGPILDAIRSRRVYATNGARILLFATVAGAPMGSSLSRSRAEGSHLVFFAETSAPAASAELIRRGQPPIPLTCEGMSCKADIVLEGLREGDYLYLRIRQSDGGAAWSSPFFIEG